MITGNKAEEEEDKKADAVDKPKRHRRRHDPAGGEGQPPTKNNQDNEDNDGEEEEEDESTETSDSDACMLSTRKKLEYFRVLSLIRKGDPAITAKPADEVKFYNTEDSESSSDESAVESSRAQKRKYTLRQQMVEALSNMDLDEIYGFTQQYQEEAPPNATSTTAAAAAATTAAAAAATIPTKEEQEGARRDFLYVSNELLNLENPDSDAAWTFHEKPAEKVKSEVTEEEYEQWKSSRQGQKVLRELQMRNEVQRCLSSIWSHVDEADTSEVFLRDYFANEGWSFSQRQGWSVADTPTSADTTTTTTTNTTTTTTGTQGLTSDDTLRSGAHVALPKTSPGESLRRKSLSKRTVKKKEQRARRRQEREGKVQAHRHASDDLDMKDPKDLKRSAVSLLSSLSGRDAKSIKQLLREGSLEELDAVMRQIYADNNMQDEDEDEEEQDFKDANAADADSESSSMDEAHPKSAPTSSSSSSSAASQEKRAQLQKLRRLLFASQEKKPTADKWMLESDGDDSEGKEQLSGLSLSENDDEADGVSSSKPKRVKSSDRSRGGFRYKEVPKGSFGLSEMDLLVLPDKTLDKIMPRNFINPYNTSVDYQVARGVVRKNLERLDKYGGIDYDTSTTGKYQRPSGINPETFDEIRTMLFKPDESGGEGASAPSLDPAEEKEAKRRKKNSGSKDT